MTSNRDGSRAGTPNRDVGVASAGTGERKATVVTDDDVRNLAERFGRSSPQEVMNWALEKYGRDCAISFSGAEDVALIELAARSGKQFSVFSLDTGPPAPGNL